jgi:hypothetical protein
MSDLIEGAEVAPGLNSSFYLWEPNDQMAADRYISRPNDQGALREEVGIRLTQVTPICGAFGRSSVPRAATYTRHLSEADTHQGGY